MDPNERPSENNSIKLIRGQQGKVGWEIKVHSPIGAAMDQTLADIKAIDDQLRRDYPEGKDGK